MSLFTYGAISTPNGPLEISTGLYSIADGTMEVVGTTFRKIEASSAFYEGSWVVSALRENTEWPLNIWVRGANLGEAYPAAQEIGKALAQNVYTVTLQLGNYLFAKTCFAADHSLEASKPLLHASVIQVKAQMTSIPD